MCVASAQEKFIKKEGTFELLGFDIMVDESLSPHLIEVNTNPALFFDTASHREVIEPMLASVSFWF